MNPSRFVAFALVLGVAGAGLPAIAQVPSVQTPERPSVSVAPQAPAQAPVVVYQNPANARQVQQQLRDVLSAYPPSVRQIIQLDPSLMQREDYMAAYPALSAFLLQHPEVARNPNFYFGEPFFQPEQTDRERVLNIVQDTFQGIALLAGFLTVITLIYLLLRQAIEYRRWRRHIQIQTDVHTKLLDRMTNNQELLAYIETPAGRRFLEAPVPLLTAAAPGGGFLAPVARILWSVQIGIVVVAAGIGFWVAQASVSDADLASVFEVMGSLTMAVGIGFVVSALLSWALSLRMGLINAPSAKAEP